MSGVVWEGLLHIRSAYHGPQWLCHPSENLATLSGSSSKQQYIGISCHSASAKDCTKQCVTNQAYVIRMCCKSCMSLMVRIMRKITQPSKADKLSCLSSIHGDKSFRHTECVLVNDSSICEANKLTVYDIVVPSSAERVCEHDSTSQSCFSYACSRGLGPSTSPVPPCTKTPHDHI